MILYDCLALLCCMRKAIYDSEVSRCLFTFRLDPGDQDNLSFASSCLHATVPLRYLHVQYLVPHPARGTAQEQYIHIHHGRLLRRLRRINTSA